MPSKEITFFSIITPTHNRSEKLIRLIDSIICQDVKNWELIIVNDSPDDKNYFTTEWGKIDPRIKYFKNETNMGVNYTRNRAISYISEKSNYVIFLDDDDYFALDTLRLLSKLILTHKNVKWFLTNRAFKNEKPLTRAPYNDTLYSYAWSYLILKRIRGDATHCIETALIKESKAEFSKKIKQGEEWFFFYKIGLYSKIFYHNHNSTLTDGYDTIYGLNLRKRPFKKSVVTLANLFREGISNHIAYRPSFVLYILMRYILLIFK